MSVWEASLCVRLRLCVLAITVGISRVCCMCVGDRNRPKEQVADKLKPPFVIELKPMEIRTFNITVEYM